MQNTLVQPSPGYFFITIAIYFIIIAAIGYYASKNTNSLKDFFVLSGKAGAIVSGFAYFATQYSMSTFMGVPAITYGTGFAGMSISIPGLVFSMLIPMLFIGRKLVYLGKKHGFLTMSDYLADRYDSNGVRGFHAVVMTVFLISLMGAQTVGAGVIVNTFTGLPEWVGVVGMGIIVIIYCMAGGMKGAMLTDVLQGLLMVITAIVTFIVSVKSGGGLEEITKTLAKENIDYLTHPGAKNNFPWSAYASMIVMWSFFTIGQPTLFTKFFAMKDYRVMFKAVILGTLGMLFSATLIEWSGVNAIVSVAGLEGKQTDFIVPLLLQQNLSPIISSILIAGIVSAGMSTIDALLVVATGGVTRDIYQNIINPKATSAQIFKLSRYVTVIIGVIGIIIGVMKPAGIFDLIKFAFGGLGIWVAPVLLGMYWKKANTLSVYLGVITGIIIYLSTKFNVLPSIYKFDPLIISWSMAMIVMIIVSLCTSPNKPEVIRRHFSKE